MYIYLHAVQSKPDMPAWLNTSSTEGSYWTVVKTSNFSLNVRSYQWTFNYDVAPIKILWVSQPLR